MSHDEYLQLAMSHRFCLVAPGDFVSTHKITEAIALGAAGGGSRLPSHYHPSHIPIAPCPSHPAHPTLPIPPCSSHPSHPTLPIPPLPSHPMPLHPRPPPRLSSCVCRTEKCWSHGDAAVRLYPRLLRHQLLGFGTAGAVNPMRSESYAIDPMRSESYAR